MATSTTRHPEVLWAQRSDVIYLTINQPDVSVKVLEITPTNIKFEGVNDQTTYSFDLDFFAEIDPEASKKSVSARSIFLILAKKDQEEPYWPRLQKVKGKLSYLKTDFGKWKDEDDDDEEEAGAGGAGGMPNFDGMDFSSMAGGAGGMPDFSSMAGMGGLGGMGGMPGMPDFSNMGGDMGDDLSDSDGNDDVEEAEEIKKAD